MEKEGAAQLGVLDRVVYGDGVLDFVEELGEAEGRGAFEVGVLGRELLEEEVGGDYGLVRLLVGADETGEEGEHLGEELGVGLSGLEEVADVLDPREEALLGLELVVDLLLEGQRPVADDEG